MLRVAVLLSVGRHPVSGRERRAPFDARALELALRLPAAEIHAVHAGDPTQTALRDYLGMGLARLTVLAMPPGRDPVAPLMAHLAALAPDVIFAGNRAESGEDSGMLPYLVAQGLGCAVVADAADVTVAGGRARLTQALPRGRRRLVEARFPLVAIVGAAAPQPRQSAFARARCGIIESIVTDAPADSLLENCEFRPWRPRPKPMRVPLGGNAEERLKAMTETKAGEGRLLIQPSADEAARVIYDYLLEKRLIEEAAPRREPPNLSHLGKRV